MFILLDIDGVMVQAASWKKVEWMTDGFYEFMPNAIQNLNEIISETGASIVLTTSHKSKFSLEEWKSIFEKRNIFCGIDKLPENVDLLSRKDEVLNWLAINPVEDFVILDDDKSLHDLPQNIKDRVVLTQPLSALRKEDALKAIHILKETVLI